MQIERFLGSVWFGKINSRLEWGNWAFLFRLQITVSLYSLQQKIVEEAAKCNYDGTQQTKLHAGETLRNECANMQANKLNCKIAPHRGGLSGSLLVLGKLLNFRLLRPYRAATKCIVAAPLAACDDGLFRIACFVSVECDPHFGNLRGWSFLLCVLWLWIFTLICIINDFCCVYSTVFVGTNCCCYFFANPLQFRWLFVNPLNCGTMIPKSQGFSSGWEVF